MYSLESPNRGDSNECSQLTIIYKNRIDIPKSCPFASWPGAMVNPQWLELPMSGEIVMVPKMFKFI